MPSEEFGSGVARCDGGDEIGLSTDGTDRTECWRCGYQRPTFESCPECGGSCKPLTKRKQQKKGGQSSTDTDRSGGQP